MPKGYDNVRANREMLLDLPFNEGINLVANDISKAHHQGVTLVGPPAWSPLALSNIMTLDFNSDYLECAAAACADLDFTTGDYSILAWLYPIDTSVSMNVAGRYVLDASGWELYLFDTIINGYLTLRHHHVSLAPNLRDGCYSTGWFQNIWQFMAVTRSGLYPLHYRNGKAVPVTYDAGGLFDPDSSGSDLVIGARYTKNADYYKGQMKALRIVNRALSPSEIAEIFESERMYFGV